MGDSGLAADRGIYGRRRKTTDKRRPLLGAGLGDSIGGSTLPACCMLQLQLEPSEAGPACRSLPLQQLRIGAQRTKGQHAG